MENNQIGNSLPKDWLMFQTSLQEDMPTVGEAEETERFPCYQHHEPHQHTQQPGSWPVPPS